MVVGLINYVKTINPIKMIGNIGKGINQLFFSNRSEVFLKKIRK